MYSLNPKAPQHRCALKLIPLLHHNCTEFPQQLTFSHLVNEPSCQTTPLLTTPPLCDWWTNPTDLCLPFINHRSVNRHDTHTNFCEKTHTHTPAITHKHTLLLTHTKTHKRTRTLVKTHTHKHAHTQAQTLAKTHKQRLLLSDRQTDTHCEAIVSIHVFSLSPDDYVEWAAGLNVGCLAQGPRQRLAKRALGEGFQHAALFKWKKNACVNDGFWGFELTTSLSILKKVSL